MSKSWAGISLGLTLAATVSAQEMSAEKAAMNQVAAQWAEAWGKGDMKAIATMYTDDADFIGIDGVRHSGPGAIEAEFARIRSTLFPDTQIKIDITSVKQVKADLLVSDSLWEVTGLKPAEGKESPPTKGLSTVVMVKQAEEWRIAAHRSRIPVSPPGTQN